MNQQGDHTSVRFEREINCPTCEHDRTKLRAWASLDGLDRLKVESIAQLSDADVRLLANYGEGGVDGACEPCAPGHSANERVAAIGGPALGQPVVPRGRAVTNSRAVSFGYKNPENGKNGTGNG